MSGTMLTPTAEQAAILAGFRTGDGMVIDAAAGSGKTSTLKMIAGLSNRPGMYLAYNRAIKDDAARSFPGSIRCVTSHGLAYGPVATKYRRRLNGARVPAQQAARILGIREPARLHADRAPLAPAQLARLALAAVGRYCQSGDMEIGRQHIAKVTGLEEVHRDLADVVLPYAVRAWRDIEDPAGGLGFTHDYYLKMYQLSRPRIEVDYLLVDEAQDLNPLVQAIVGYQTHAQVILVGDRCQQLYAWRGAVDAMSEFDGARFVLSQSFRFGPAIADEANKWLTALRADIRVRGFDPVPSTVGPLTQADAILCRSNGGTITRLMRSLAEGRRTALVGGGGDIARMARAARDLMDGRPTEHPELLAFANWREVQAYVDAEEGGSDLRVFVTLVDKHGPEELLRIVDQLCDERVAETVISTAHKAKGREWNHVQIATDFRAPVPDPVTNTVTVSRDELMLAYVAVTRAKLRLDPEGLAWIDSLDLGGRPRSLDALIDESSLGAPEAVAARASVSAAGQLTGMPAEQADWDATPPPVRRSCWRCGSVRCLCDPAAKQRSAALLGRSV